jgi:hypothetical protein
MTPTWYRIVVAGELSDRFASAFDGMTLQCSGGQTGQLSVGFGRLLAVGGAADGGEHVSATSKSRPGGRLPARE